MKAQIQTPDTGVKQAVQFSINSQTGRRRILYYSQQKRGVIFGNKDGQIGPNKTNPGQLQIKPANQIKMY